MSKPTAAGAWGAVALAIAMAAGTAVGAESKLVHEGQDGKLVYAAASDRGDTIPDFSNCGYGGGGVKLPGVAVKVTLSPEAGATDDTGRIQAAVDAVGKMPADERGFRGAVLLKRGRYVVAGTIRMGVSGVVLRGEGMGDGGTVIFASGAKERNVIDVRGKGGPRGASGSKVNVVDEYVPVGARSFSVADGSKFKAGDAVLVTRVGNKDWIHFIKMDQITERPGHPGSTKQWGPFNLVFDRVVTKVEGNKVTVDAPITCAMDAKWGGGFIEKASDEGRIENCGVENLSSDSAYDPKVTKTTRNGRAGEETAYPADEHHAIYLVEFANVKNAWLRDVATTHYYNGPVNVVGGAKWVTVQDCRCVDPVSEITGGRRYPYAIQGGQLVLIQRCYSRDDRHAFVVGSRVEGPNVFLDDVSEHPHATSEPHHRWSVGGLYDNVHADMAFQDRQWMGSGHGWAGANYVVWNCEGSLVLQQPPTAQNWAIGFVGRKAKGAFPGRPEGYWESFGTHVEPRSLYLKQLEDRLGKGAVANVAK